MYKSHMVTVDSISRSDLLHCVTPANETTSDANISQHKGTPRDFSNGHNSPMRFNTRHSTAKAAKSRVRESLSRRISNHKVGGNIIE